MHCRAAAVGCGRGIYEHAGGRTEFPAGDHDCVGHVSDSIHGSGGTSGARVLGAPSDDAGRYLALAAVVVWQTASPLIRGVLLTGASGVAFGVSSVVTKAVPADFTWLGATAVGVLAVTGYLLGQASYRGGGLAAPLAMVSVANPAVAATIWVLVLGEGVRFGTLGAVLARGAAVVAAIGVVGLSRRTVTTPPVATTTASSTRELVHTGPPHTRSPSAVTGSSITASTSVTHA